MTQVRHQEYKDQVTSLDNDVARLGFIEPGVYRGFDTIYGISGLEFSLKHDGDGIQHLLADGVTLCDKKGILITKQGIVTSEDAGIGPFTIDTNFGNANKRMDLLVCQHIWSNSIQGGEEAVYSIIKGSLSSFLEPDLDDPNSQIIIGRIILPAGAAAFSADMYERAEAKGLGNKDFARRDASNIYLGSEDWHKGTNAEIDTEKLDLDFDGNTYYVDINGNTYLDGILKPSQEGVMYYFRFSDDIILRGASDADNTIDSDALAAGYRALNLPENTIDSNYQWLVPAGAIVPMLFENNKWNPFCDSIGCKLTYLEIDSRLKSLGKARGLVIIEKTGGEATFDGSDAGLGIVVPFNSAIYDPSTKVNLTTHLFKPGVLGFYKVEFHVKMRSPSSTNTVNEVAYIDILKNGSTVAEVFPATYKVDNGAEGKTMDIHRVIEITDVNDTISFKLSSGAIAGNIYYSAAYFISWYLGESA